MKIHCIGNQSLTEAFELIGVEGHLAGPDTDIAGLLSELAEQHEAALFLVQSGLAERLSFALRDELARRSDCLVIEVPGIHEPPVDPAAFRQTIQRAMGASL